jgi:bifunctional non-homologous end joining protein LigD
LPAKAKVSFIEPMLLQRTNALSADVNHWEYQLKFDGYRAIAFKSEGKVHLRSRNDNDFSIRYSSIVKALSRLPNETVIDGEIIAFDASGRPSFNLLQNHGSAPDTPLAYFVFDILMLAGKSVMDQSLEARQKLLEERILPELSEPIRYAGGLEGSLADLVAAVKTQGLESRGPGGKAPGQRL